MKAKRCPVCGGGELQYVYVGYGRGGRVMAATMWPYGKCVKCARINFCGDSKQSITNCMENGFKDFRPITNADKYFRNATDEELAKIIVRAKYFDKFCEIVLAGENPGFCDDNCNECALDWLKQEVEIDA